MRHITRSQRGVLLLCFFFSGVAALIFEVLWVRHLTLSLGHTTLAVSVVLAAFMAGLAFGSAFGGKWADKVSPHRLLFFYGCFEIGIGVLGWLSRFLIDQIQILIPRMGVWESSAFFQSVVWFSVCFLPLIGPTFLMGATLPFMTRWFNLSQSEKFSSDSPSSIGILYGINTLGAVLGVSLAGFVLIPALGLGKCYLTAGLLNLLSGLAAFAAAAFVKSPLDPSDNSPLPAKAEASEQSSRQWKLTSFLFLSGMAALMCEVAWTRLFALVIGSSTYAFTIMLTTFLLGLSLGSLFFEKLRGLFRPSWGNLSFLFMLLGAGILAYLPFFNQLPYYFSRLFPFTKHGLWALHTIQFSLCASVMIFPTLLMGMTLPWAIATLKTDPRTAASSIGFSYSANTVGGIIGSAAAGLVFMPFWGAEQTLILAAWLYAGTAAWILLLNKEIIPLKKGAISLAVFVVLLGATRLRPALDPRILSSGAFLYAPDYMHLSSYAEFVEDIHKNRVLFHTDGFSTTVTVLESPWGARFLRVNGKTDASSTRDMMTQMMQGYLARLLHPGQPKNALVVGLGSGVTAGAVSVDQKIERIDCVEIEPAVQKAAQFFSEINHDVINDPRLRFIHADARHYLAATSTTYDLITSEPSNPWIAGVANLFTKEAFELTKKRLSPDGVFCQWFHSYSMKRDDFKMVVNTFASVFPHVLLFTSGENDFFLIGSKKPWDINYRRIGETISAHPAMQADLAVLGLRHPFTLLATTFLLDDPDVRRFAQGAPIHSDETPTLEFSAPRYLHRSEDRLILESLMASKQGLLPKNITGLDVSKKEWNLLYNLAGEAFMRLRHLGQAELAFSRAMGLDNSNARTWVNQGRIHNLKNEHLQAEKAFKKSISLDSSFALGWFHLGMLYLEQGLEDNGLKALEAGLTHAPGDPMGSLQLGALYMRKGKVQQAKNVVEAALRRPISNSEIHHHLMDLRNALEQKPSSENNRI